ncbi:MAG: phage virion morphogenesis protein [Dinoroseobacter sp.]|nr:phage virion morphogenesis protein [Dinoroseobacter sp.]
MVQLNINLLDLGTVQALDGLTDLDDDLTPLMDNIGALLEQSARTRIESTNVGPDGSPWPQSMRAVEDGGRTLFESGRLAASLTHEADRREARIGSNLIYAGVHQSGATITPTSGRALQFQLPNGEFVTVGKVTIPARPYLGISEEDELEIGELVSDFVSEATGGAVQ